MVSKFQANPNQVYFVTKRTMYHVLKGTGGIQVDFKNYFDWKDKLIFLETGQYIKFLSEGFEVRKIEFEDEDLFNNSEVRVLFKHLISLGYINFSECTDCQRYLNNTVFSEPQHIIDVSSKHWYWQNPFNANSDEYHLIFDVKELVDQQYKNHLSNSALVKLMGGDGANAYSLITDKVGVSIRNLLGNKRLTESKKEIAFSGKSIKEISYEYGYKDPAYFNRVFKKQTGTTPVEFRDKLEFSNQDTFAQNLFELIRAHHKSDRQVAFYADKLKISSKSLSNKVKEELQVSIGQLIRQFLVNTSKEMLSQGNSVKEISHELGFEEANHFSAFFKHYSGESPTNYITNQK